MSNCSAEREAERVVESIQHAFFDSNVTAVERHELTLELKESMKDMITYNEVFHSARISYLTNSVTDETSQLEKSLLKIRVSLITVFLAGMYHLLQAYRQCLIKQLSSISYQLSHNTTFE